MEQRLKERLTGAAVLMLGAVIFIPMILDNAALETEQVLETRAPAGPPGYQSRIVPVQEASPPARQEAGELQTGSIDDNRPPGPVSTADSTRSGQAPVEAAIASTGPDTSTTKPADPVTATAAPRTLVKPPTGGNGLDAWVVQLGSFSSKANAETLVRDLQAQDYPAYIEEISNQSGRIYRVRVGPELNKADAEQAIKSLAAKFGLKGILLTYP